MSPDFVPTHDDVALIQPKKLTEYTWYCYGCGHPKVDSSPGTPCEADPPCGMKVSSTFISDLAKEFQNKKERKVLETSSAEEY